MLTAERLHELRSLGPVRHARPPPRSTHPRLNNSSANLRGLHDSSGEASWR